MIQRPTSHVRRHRILVIDDDPSIQTVFAEVLDDEHFEVCGAVEASAGLRRIEDWHPDLVVLDHRLPDRTGLELLPEITSIDRHLPILFMTATQSPDTAIEAMKLGAFDYATKPVPLERLSDQVMRGIENRRLLRTPVVIPESAADKLADGADHLIGRCSAMQSIYKSIGQLAAYDIPALIQGEPGTGKKLTARAIHAHGCRSQQVLRTLRCGDYAGDQLERELFGSAPSGRDGLLAACHGGTLILEEIADLPPAAQSSLLLHMRDQARIARERMHGDGCYDVTLIFTTTHDVDELVARRHVRSDLFYELSGSILSLPPLRDREGDIRLLVEHYVQRLLRISSQQATPPRVSDGAIEILSSYRWPGNIAELKSVLRRALMENRGTVLASDYLRRLLAEPRLVSAASAPREKDLHASPPAMQPVASEPSPSQSSRSEPSKSGIPQLQRSDYWRSFVAAHEAEPSGSLYGNAIEQLERGLLSATLESTQGNLAQAARLLGMTRVSLRKKIQKLELEIPGRAAPY